MSGKRGRSGISLDMTAMCDMAFLLLTFFILTAKMKAPELVQVDIPNSRSEKLVPDKNLIRITIDKDGIVYLSLTEATIRRKMIDEVSTARGLNLSEAEKVAFANTEMFGMPLNQLKGFFSMPASKRDEYKQPGIPVDSTNNELKMWIKEAKSINNQLIIAIKGDKESNYENYTGVVGTLQSLRLNKFSLITAL
ncbi:MAG TPA: biopolymer transporter ExbD [Cytophagaceae bacterium]|jgi:biopolymer transport protein ExbD|nr:biopolymer transporter ExbD [Cytophagaceae bacterium]